MADLPDTIQVGPFRYTIVCDDAAHAKVVRDHGSDVYGLVCYQAQTITLAPANGNDIQAASLVHELLHALCHATGADGLLEDTHADTEERLIQILAPSLLNLLRTNPHLVKYLVA